MRQQFSIRSLFALLTICATAIWLVQGLLAAGEPYWAVYLIGFTSVCSGVCGMLIAALDRGLSTLNRARDGTGALSRGNGGQELFDVPDSRLR